MAITDRLGRTVGTTTPDDSGTTPNAGLAIKTPVRVASTANITLSGLQTIDGVTVEAGDRVLVKDQADATQNGIYNASSGNWLRAIDFDGNNEAVDGTQVYVCEGSLNGGKTSFVSDSGPVTPGASEISFATAFEQLSYSGLQINGCFDVDQQALGELTLSSGTGQYCVDAWKGLFIHSTAVIKCSKVTISDLPGFSSAFQLKAGTAGNFGSGPGSGATDIALIDTYIEGYRAARLAMGTSVAQPLAIGFWVKASVPGVGAVKVGNHIPNRTYINNFTINAANTWEFKTVHLTTGDVTGDWAYDNRVGANLIFTFGSGATYQTAPGAWQPGNFYGTTSVSSGFFATINNVVQITGVIVLPGLELPHSRQLPIIHRDAAFELWECRRTFLRWGSLNAFPITQGYNDAGANNRMPLPFPREMRDVPVATVNGTWGAFNCGQPSFDFISTQGCAMKVTVTALGSFSSFPASGCSVDFNARL